MISSLGDRIRENRERLQYTQQQLSEMLGVSVSQICRYEKGESVPLQENILSLASIFHMSIDELMGAKKRTRWASEEGERRVISIKNGEVCRPQFFSRVNEFAVTIYPDGIRFSTPCVRKWLDTEYVDIIVIKEQNLLVIRKSDQDDYNSQRWCREKDSRIYGRKITGHEFSRRLYRMMKWCRGYAHKVSGYIGVNAADITEEIWYFDLAEAEGIPMSGKGREKCGVVDSEIEARDLEKLDAIEKQINSDKEERKIMIAEGKKPGPAKKYIIQPDAWGQYMFGFPEDLQTGNASVEIKA